MGLKVKGDGLYSGFYMHIQPTSPFPPLTNLSTNIRSQLPVDHTTLAAISAHVVNQTHSQPVFCQVPILRLGELRHNQGEGLSQGP